MAIVTEYLPAMPVFHISSVVTMNMMTIRLFGMLAVLALKASGLAGQAPAAIDTSKLGPQVGAVVPGFSGIDQFGQSRTLASTYGPKGAMLVFFRSADW